ncbi:MAG: transcriptional regulator [Chlorobiaceae bacterium]|nr:transcriptional regulator [Chlorobiaceae bacterium]
MTTVKSPRLKIVEKSHWISRHPEAGYTKHVRLIDSNIIHTWVESEKSIVMDFMDVELLKLVLGESGLMDKPFYIIFDLKNVEDISYRYKKSITDLLFNWEPYLSCVCFFQVANSMKHILASFLSVAPEKFCITQSDTYRDALQKIQAYKTRGSCTDNTDASNNLESSDIRQQFVSAIAKISWLNLLDVPIAAPPSDSIYFHFFKSLESLRRDLWEKETEREKKTAQIREECENRITQMTIKMNAQSEVSKKASQQLKLEIEELRTRVATQDMELTRISTAIAEKTAKLRRLLEQITELDIDLSLKNSMTNSCLSLIETETIGKRLDVEMTESDSVFLSKLQKKHPNLNQREMRIALLVKLNYDTKDIADSLSISTRGMESIRYRMHKKLGLGKHQSIKTYLSDVAIGM